MTDGEPELDPRPSALDRLEGLATEPTRRPTRFDRPPEPHDWRWVVGGLGRTFIAIGVLMFAFVGYQLWGTGIQTAAAQDRLSREFDEMLAAQATAVTSTVAPTTVAPTTSVGATPTTVAAPTTVAPTTVPPAVITAPAEGEPVARLEIGSIDLDWSVIEGVRSDDLANGPGHFPETPLPGQLGNSALAGHRTTHGAPFGRIAEIEVGDQIVVTTLAGRFVYVVSGTLIVNPDEYGRVIPTVDATRATLTLTSCHPKWTTRQRYVVQAELDVSLSDPVTAPAPVLPAPSDDQPTDLSLAPTETTSADTEPTASTTADTSTGSTPDATSTSTASATDTTPTSTVPAAATDTEASEDVFQNTWFADDGAWVHVALWGLVLVAVSIGSWLVSRRARRNWVGALVGIAPFVVVLYFWFENVNRLLPANL